jgi:hypothetical protein
MPRISGKLGTVRTGDGPAAPRPPSTQLPTGLVHAVRIVLEVYTRIPQEAFPSVVDQNPGKGLIRHRVSLEQGVLRREIGPHRPVETEYGTRRECPQPLAMRVLQHGEVKKGPPLPPKPLDMTEVHARNRSGEGRAGRAGLLHAENKRDVTAGQIAGLVG